MKLHNIYKTEKADGLQFKILQNNTYLEMTMTRSYKYSRGTVLI